MDKIEKQRLAQLVRMGIVPSTKLQVLMQALAKAKLGTALSPVERNVMSIYLDKVQSFVLGNQSEFNRAKLHTQRTKYHTEETTVDIDENVRVVDGPEDMEVDQRMKDERKAKRLSIKKRDKYRLLSPELKKEKKKANMDEEVVALNDTYKEMFEATLEYFEVSNIRDLPEDKKKEFFATVDEALEEAKMAKKDYDGDGKIETSTAEYMGSRDKAIKKAMKKEEFILDEDDVVLVIDEEMTTGYRPDMGHVGTQGTIRLGGKEHNARKVPIKHYDEFKKKHPGSKVMFRGPRDGKAMHTKKSNAQHFYIVHKKGGVKEEVEQIDELKKSTLSSYIQKAADPVAKKSNVNLASKAAHKLATSDDMDAGEKEDRKAFVRSKGIQTAAKKLAKEGYYKDIDTKKKEDERLAKKPDPAKVTKEEATANMPNKKVEGDKESPKQGSSEKPAVGELAPAQDSSAKLKEAMSPEFKAKRLDMIRQAHDRVLTGKTRDAAAAKKAAKSAMKQKGAQKGMAPTKKDVEEQVKELRKMIREGNDKIEAYKLLNKILNNKETLGE